MPASKLPRPFGGGGVRLYTFVNFADVGGFFFVSFFFVVVQYCVFNSRVTLPDSRQKKKMNKKMYTYPRRHEIRRIDETMKNFSASASEEIKECLSRWSGPTA